MNYKCLSNGEGRSGSSATRKARTTKRTEKPELGALKLNADEVAEFEKWITEPKRPTEFMLQAARTHRSLLLRQKR
jgi:hypothetical protein